MSKIMRKVLILWCSIGIPFSSYSGVFTEKNTCFEAHEKNVIFLPNETDPYTGIYLCKFENGQKEREGNYLNGKFDGRWTTWYESGLKKSEANYKNGKLDGRAIWWSKRGQKIRQKQYSSGKLDGKLIEWFQSSGEIKREENYKNGKILF